MEEGEKGLPRETKDKDEGIFYFFIRNKKKIEKLCEISMYFGC